MKVYIKMYLQSLIIDGLANFIAHWIHFEHKLLLFQPKIQIWCEGYQWVVCSHQEANTK